MNLVNGMRFFHGAMSVHGYKQTSSRPKSTSALPPKGDIYVAIFDFRL
jgi:hypothetical protein